MHQQTDAELKLSVGNWDTPSSPRWSGVSCDLLVSHLRDIVKTIANWRLLFSLQKFYRFERDIVYLWFTALKWKQKKTFADHFDLELQGLSNFRQRKNVGCVFGSADHNVPKFSFLLKHLRKTDFACRGKSFRQTVPMFNRWIDFFKRLSDFGLIVLAMPAIH